MAKRPPKFGDRLRALREEKGLNREQLAVQLDISLATLARLELKTNDPSPRVLRKIVAAFPELESAVA